MTEQETILLHSEDLVVGKRTIERDRVRINTVTHSHDERIEQPLTHERVEIEHVPVGIYVDTVPPVRQEGDLTILPVVEEVVVVERRLLLKSEVHVRRVRTTELHVETVALRTQDAIVTRIPAAPPAALQMPSDQIGRFHIPTQKASSMNEETIVAVYDTQAHAEAVVRDLEAAGVPPAAISRHGNGAQTTTGAAPARERGFWSSLFGGEPDHDTAVYDRSVESGSCVVTVKAPAEHILGVTEILERHNPVDIDERAAGYGLGRTTAAQPAVAAPAARPGAGAGADTVYGSGEAVIALSEEQIAVGKRLVDRGTTRVRRFVVETPVEQDVTLHSERVSIERRPVTGSIATAPEFADRVIEMTETDEEVVTAKTAHVVEEVVVRKDATDRVETVRDTVRREEVEITKDAADSRMDARPVARPKI